MTLCAKKPYRVSFKQNLSIGNHRCFRHLTRYYSKRENAIQAAKEYAKEGYQFVTISKRRLERGVVLD